MDYNNGIKYRRLRTMLGAGLCISRGTASVLNACCAFVPIPVCKKLNQLVYKVFRGLWPRPFFFWLECAKSCHIIVATTLLVFAVTHSTAHFVNLWSFSKNYDPEFPDLNFADHKDQNPLQLLLTLPVYTGISMLFIIIVMACSSTRAARRIHYNFFRYAHQMSFVFIALLLVHPMSGALKEEALDPSFATPNATIQTYERPIFVPIESKTWKWMFVPLLCCSADLMWRLCSRNRTYVGVVQATILPGGAISLTLRTERRFSCRAGQYVLIQCTDISSLEWHPFSLTKVPTESQPYVGLLISIKGDWTEALETIIQKRNNFLENPLQLLMDGPYASPLESIMKSEVAICVAAGIGITPFSSLLHTILRNPMSSHPGRVHLIWIVRKQCQLLWIADLLTKTILQLRDANRPDKLHIEFYITRIHNENEKSVTVHMDKKEMHKCNHARKDQYEKALLLTPKAIKVVQNDCRSRYKDQLEDDVLRRYPILWCRVKWGRPRWESLFDHWTHLYPNRDHLPLFCCGPKKLTATLRHHCLVNNLKNANLKFKFIHEGFS